MKTFEVGLKPKEQGTRVSYRVTAPGYVLARVIERSQTD